MTDTGVANYAAWAIDLRLICCGQGLRLMLP